LDASYRIQLLGYKAVYLEDLLSPGETPPTLPSYKKQQARWANGSLKAAKKLLPTLIKDRSLGLKKKIEGFLHLTYYFVHPLIVASFILNSIAALVNFNYLVSSPQFSLGQLLELPVLLNTLSSWLVQNIALVSLFLAIAFSAFAVWFCMLVTVKRQKMSIFRQMPSLLLLGIMGYGISLSNAVAAMRGLLSKKPGNFNRTPKYDVKTKTDQWKDKKYQIAIDSTTILEILAAICGSFCMVFAAIHSNFATMLVLVPYVVSYLTVAMLTLKQSRREV